MASIDTAMPYASRHASKTVAFPPIVADFASDSEGWPRPPFAWDHEPIDSQARQPCRLSLRNGREVEGDLWSMEPLAGRMLCRRRGAVATSIVPFEQLLSCLLTEPLTPLLHAGKLPLAEHERDFRLVMADGRVLAGRTVGRVELAHGLFLFPPLDIDRSVQRLFVPRAAYVQAEFGPTTVDKAAAAWISTPAELLAAIERQATVAVLSMGAALTNLGLATPQQIERALAMQAADGDRPLGQIVVATGVITQPDLEAALAHKMGCPLVDVDGFPIEARALRSLPLRTVSSQQALPLMLDGDRIFLAVDSPSREVALRGLKLTTGLTPVIALARRSALVRRLAMLAAQDVWQQEVRPERKAAAAA